MLRGSDYTTPRHPAVDFATSFILQSMQFIYYCCLILLCLLISSRGVSDELNEILMRVSPRMRGRRRQLRLSDSVQSAARTAFLRVIDKETFKNDFCSPARGGLSFVSPVSMKTNHALQKALTELQELNNSLTSKINYLCVET